MIRGRKKPLKKFILKFEAQVHMIHNGVSEHRTGAGDPFGVDTRGPALFSKNNSGITADVIMSYDDGGVTGVKITP